MAEPDPRPSDERTTLPHDAVAKVRASNDAWHRRDVDAVLAPYSGDAEWDTTEAWPDGRTYHGVESLRAYFDDVLERWGAGEHRMDIDEILEVEGRPSLLVSYRMSGRSHAGVPISGTWVHLFDFRDGEIIRVRNFRSFDAAAATLAGINLARVWPAPPGGPSGDQAAPNPR